jgi:hypothetical protein
MSLAFEGADEPDEVLDLGIVGERGRAREHLDRLLVAARPTGPTPTTTTTTTTTTMIITTRIATTITAATTTTTIITTTIITTTITTSITTTSGIVPVRHSRARRRTAPASGIRHTPLSRGGHGCHRHCGQSSSEPLRVFRVEHPGSRHRRLRTSAVPAKRGSGVAGPRVCASAAISAYPCPSVIAPPRDRTARSNCATADGTISRASASELARASGRWSRRLRVGPAQPVQPLGFEQVVEAYLEHDRAVDEVAQRRVRIAAGFEAPVGRARQTGRYRQPSLRVAAALTPVREPAARSWPVSRVRQPSQPNQQALSAASRSVSCASRNRRPGFRSCRAHTVTRVSATGQTADSVPPSKGPSALDPHSLLALAGEIAGFAAPDTPEGTSMRDFNAAREPSGHANAPSAEAIHQRFNRRAPKVRWAEILRVACSDADPNKWIAIRERAAVRTDLTDEDCSYALRVVCRERGGESFSSDHYSVTRRRLIARDRRRASGGLLDELLPTANQITHHYANWNQALHAAGIPEFEQSPTPTRTTRLLREGRSLGIVEAMEQFAITNGRLSGKGLLRRFCAQWDVALADPEPGVPWETYLVAAEKLWRARGEDPPPRPKQSRWLPPITAPTERPEGIARHGHHLTVWNRERIIEKLREYVRALGSRRGSQRHYRQYLSAHPELDWPASATIGKHGLRFQEALAEARRRERQEAPADAGAH